MKSGKYVPIVFIKNILIQIDGEALKREGKRDKHNYGDRDKIRKNQKQRKRDRQTDRQKKRKERERRKKRIKEERIERISPIKTFISLPHTALARSETKTRHQRTNYF